MRLFVIIMCLLVTGCNLALDSTTPETTPSPQPEPTIRANTNENDTGWQRIALGMEERTFRNGDRVQFRAIRIDPIFYDFRAHYRAGDPLRINEWADALPDAAMILNANFFDPENRVLGLLVSDGVRYGQSYRRGGTFVIDDGEPAIYYNPQTNYANLPIDQAVQAFPMLVLNGAQAYTNSNDRLPARRTVIAEDDEGRVIVIVTLGFGLGLYPLSEWLPTSDMNIVNAFNLDGGGSTMLYTRPNDRSVLSFDPVPSVLALYPR